MSLRQKKKERKRSICASRHLLEDTGRETAHMGFVVD